MTAKDIIIFAGVAGAGKTDARSITRELIEQQGFTCRLISDGETLVSVVEEDQEKNWHVCPHEHEGNPAFCITHQYPLDEAVRRWVAQVPPAQERQISLVEVARGVGSRYPELDLSFGRLLESNLVPQEIWQRSVMVYVRTPRYLRFAWNEERRQNPRSQLGEVSFFVPPLAMETLFGASDFKGRLLPGLREMGVPTYVIENNTEGFALFRRNVEGVASQILRTHLPKEGQFRVNKERGQ
jgi:hypothetical protein